MVIYFKRYDKKYIFIRSPHPAFTCGLTKIMGPAVRVRRLSHDTYAPTAIDPATEVTNPLGLQLAYSTGKSVTFVLSRK